MLVLSPDGTGPGHFSLSVIEPKLKPLEGDTDVSIMWNTVAGVKNGD